MTAAGVTERTALVPVEVRAEAATILETLRATLVEAVPRERKVARVSGTSVSVRLSWVALSRLAGVADYATGDATHMPDPERAARLQRAVAVALTQVHALVDEVCTPKDGAA